MDRRDFLKTLAVTGAVMTVQRSEAMDILAQKLTNAGGGKVDLVAVMGGETRSDVPACHCGNGWHEAVYQTGTESSGQAQYRLG